MFVRDHPRPVNLAKAGGDAYPDVGRLAAGSFAADSVEAVGEGHVMAGGDAQLANLASDRTLERRKPALPILASAPRYCRGAVTSNSTMSGEWLDISSSMFLARNAAAHSSIILRISASLRVSLIVGALAPSPFNRVPP
jgi:hypothetical protein